MFQATHLIGFGVKRPAAGGTPTLIAHGDGAIVGDMTSNGGTAASFDNTTSQDIAACSRAAGGTPRGWVGKDWNGVGGGTKTITRYRVFPSNDHGFEAAANNIRIKLKGDNSATPSGFTNTTVGFNAGTELHTADYSDATGAPAAGINPVDVTSGITTTTAYRYHWVEVMALAGANEVYIAEVQFYETI